MHVSVGKGRTARGMYPFDLARLSSRHAARIVSPAILYVLSPLDPVCPYSRDSVRPLPLPDMEPSFIIHLPESGKSQACGRSIPFLRIV